jgi:toxin FitB
MIKGIALKQRTDPRAAVALTVWLEQLRLGHSDRILPISDRVALEWGRLVAERPRGMADGLIAATAMVHSKIIVTRNVDDFSDTGVPVINPWSQ